MATKTPAVRLPKGSAIEQLMAHQLYVAGVPIFVREHPFAAELGRRWRFDFAWPARFLALECEGGVWTGGRHTTGSGFTKDAEKYSEAAVMGWRVIRATAQQVRSGKALQWVERALSS